MHERLLKRFKRISASEITSISLIFLLICGIAWPGMSAPLILDDVDQMNHVQRFTSWRSCFSTDCYALFRPFKNIVYYGLKNQTLFHCHVFTLATYLTASLSIYFLLRRLLHSWIYAALAVILWATCPTQVSAAIWLTCFNINLAVSLCCTYLILHDHSRQGTPRNILFTILAGLSLFMSQLFYETSVAIPALCIGLDFIRKRSIFSREALLRYATYGIITLLYLFIRSSSGATHSAHTSNYAFSPTMETWQLILSAPWFLWKHFSMWLMPVGRLEFLGTYIWGVSASPWALAAVWLWLFAMIGLIFYTRKRQPWIAFGLFWFLVTSFPASNFIPLWNGPITDCYLIYPSVGLAIALIGCGKWLCDWGYAERSHPGSSKKIIASMILGALILWRALGIPLFWNQSDLWNRPLELYLRYELSRPGQFQLQSAAATEFLKQGNPAQAKVLALKSHKIAPWHGSSSMILGKIAYDEGDLTSAQRYFGQAMLSTPENAPPHEFVRLYLAKTLISQPSQRHLIRKILLPVLRVASSSYHEEAILTLIECYRLENKPADALRVAEKGVAQHPKNQTFAAILQELKTQLKPALEAEK